MNALTRALAVIGALALGLGGALVVASPAAAAAFTVTKNADDGLPGSLTYALANLVPGGNTITISTSGPITIPGAIPVITEDVDIVGPTGGVTIETTDTIGHFAISSSTVTMTDVDLRPNLGGIDSGIEISDSVVTLTRVSVEGFDFGITASDSTLTADGLSLLNNVTVGLFFADSLGTNPLSLSNATLGGTALAHVGTGAVLFGAGATISLRTVTSAFTDTAGIVLGSDIGDIILDTITVEDAGIGINLGASGGSATTAQHITVNRTLAGLYVSALDDAELDVNDLHVDETDGDGVDITAINGSRATLTSATVTGSAGSGFILDATDSTIELRDSTSSGNGTGGGCGCGGGSGVEIYADNSAVTLDRVGSTGNTATFGGGVSVLSAVAGSTLKISSSTITGNTVTDDGGGIDVDLLADDGTSLTISDSTVSGNHAADFGGGIHLREIGDGVVSTAKVTIVRTTIADNTSDGYGAGVAVEDPAAETSGLPTVLIDSSTLTNNTTPAGGGGVYIGKYSAPEATVVAIVNSTISGNFAQAGGAVYVEAVGFGGPNLLTTVISHSTLVGNSAHTSGGVELNSGDHDLAVDNSILAGSVSDNGSTPNDLQLGSPYTVRFSLVQTPDTGIVLSPADGNITGVDPQLAPLALNGGTTKTHLIAPGSPAYNAGDPTFSGAGLFDQRGQARVYQRLDMGAVEWQPALAVTGSAAPAPEPPLIAALLILSGIAMIAFSRLQVARSVS